MHLLPLLVCSSLGGNSVGKQIICVSKTMSLCTFWCVLKMSPGVKQENFVKMAPGLEGTDEDLCDLVHALLSPVSMGNGNVQFFLSIWSLHY